MTQPDGPPGEAADRPDEKALREAAAVLADGMHSWWTQNLHEGGGYEWEEVKDRAKAIEVFIALKTVWPKFAAALGRSGGPPDDKWLKHLAWHHLAGIDCNHEQGTDSPRCACSQWPAGDYPTAGAAVEAWARHVIATFPAERPIPLPPRDALLGIIRGAFLWAKNAEQMADEILRSGRLGGDTPAQHDHMDPRFCSACKAYDARVPAPEPTRDPPHTMNAIIATCEAAVFTALETWSNTTRDERTVDQLLRDVFASLRVAPASDQPA